MQKILIALFLVIMQLIIFMAIYYISKFTLFNGEDLSFPALCITFGISGILSEIIRRLITKKRPR